MDPLLEILKNDARTSLEDLARMTASTPEDVAAKIDGYEKTGVIRGYQAILNEDVLSLPQVNAVIEVKVRPEREGGFDPVATRIARFDEVESVYLMSGGTYDLVLFIRGESLQQVASFVARRLSTLDGVLATATHFMLKTYKRFGVLMEPAHADDRLQVSP